MLTLFNALLQIIFFRKGPDSIPHSAGLFMTVVTLWVAVGAFGIIAVENYSGSSLLMDLVLTIFGLSLYALLINAFGKDERILRAVTAILGCSIIFGMTLFLSSFFISSGSGEGEVTIVAELILLWSILVKGHIIARTIERLWMIGFLIALSVFIAQLQLIVFLNPMIDKVS